MRWFCCIAVCLSAGLPLSAADAPPALTSKEIAEGWIQLFDGETLFGWKVVGEAKWAVEKGALTSEQGKEGMLFSTTEFGDCTIQMQYRLGEHGEGSVLVRCDAEGRGAGPGSTDKVDLLHKDWVDLQVVVKNGSVHSYTTKPHNGIVGVHVNTLERPGVVEQPRRGRIALRGKGLTVRNLRLQPQRMQPLFNGKDLSGWKVNADPKYKSKFTVGKDGTLDIKDGPGDIQTTGQWADFILQAECKTNGDGLNSGIFFRCRPDEYQQGYEAQIHNKFNAAAPKEYAIEEYDPKTHELKGTKKEKYDAVDYGTGAIYRRQPARKQASKDGEWLTMTVIAHGNHFGVWVNGVMVTDWTDNRPLKDNARAGCRLEKGPISLQGHDPTTDLSFRNIRLAELPAEKK